MTQMKIQVCGGVEAVAVTLQSQKSLSPVYVKWSVTHQMDMRDVRVLPAVCLDDFYPTLFLYSLK